jgi:hypothetical protein
MVSIEITKELQALLDRVVELRSKAIKSDNMREAKQARHDLHFANIELTDYLQTAIKTAQ